MKNAITFLDQLLRNNNRDWFNIHKSEYLEIQSRFNDFVSQLIAVVSFFDETIKLLTVKIALIAFIGIYVFLRTRALTKRIWGPIFVVEANVRDLRAITFILSRMKRHISDPTFLPPVCMLRRLHKLSWSERPSCTTETDSNRPLQKQTVLSMINIIPCAEC